MNRSEGELTQLIAYCEQQLWLLEKELRDFQANKNPIIKHNIECAKQTAALSLENLADGNAVKADIFADITLLRTKFAAKIFEAERMEALLGEAEFLELTEDWQGLAGNSLKAMEQAINRLSEQLQSSPYFR